MSNDRIDFSRRKVLAGIGIAGLGAAGAGLGTTAFLNDTESFENNVLTAGTLNLLVDYYSYWDQGMAGSGSVTGTQDGSGTVSGVLDDVKPGDNGLLAFCPRIDDNPGYLWLCGELTSNDDNGLIEPEAVVDASGGDGEGELAQNVEITVSYCDLDSDIADADDDDATNDGFEPSDATQIAEIWTGTLADFLAAIENGVPLDGDATVPAGGAFHPPGDQACFDGLGGDVVDNPCLCIDWEVPVEVGNVIQSDSLTFDLEFHAEQCRHNDGTNNPCAGDITCEPCELPTGVSPSPEITVLSTDASNFPTVSLFAQVDTTDGNAGNLTAADFELCEDGFAQEESVTFQSNRQADIVFVFDDTGSMGAEIQGAKNAINNFVSSIDAVIDARYALVSYNDAVTVDQDFTTTPGDIQSAVNALTASGGGGFREDNFDALAVATGNEGLTLQESSPLPSLAAYRSGAQRVIIDITDAPAHTENTIEGSGPPTGTVTDLNMTEVGALLAGYTYIAVSEPVPPGGDQESYATGDKQALATNVGGIWYDLPQSNSDEFSALLEEDVVGLLTTTYEISYTTCNDVTDGSARSVNFEVTDPSGTLYGTGSYTAPSS